VAIIAKVRHASSYEEHVLLELVTSAVSSAGLTDVDVFFVTNQPNSDTTVSVTSSENTREFVWVTLTRDVVRVRDPVGGRTLVSMCLGDDGFQTRLTETLRERWRRSDP